MVRHCDEAVANPESASYGLRLLRTEISTQRDSDEHRVIVSYPLNIL